MARYAWLLPRDGDPRLAPDFGSRVAVAASLVVVAGVASLANTVVASASAFSSVVALSVTALSTTAFSAAASSMAFLAASTVVASPTNVVGPSPLNLSDLVTVDVAALESDSCAVSSFGACYPNSGAHQLWIHR
jgi:hypothetical protein